MQTDGACSAGKANCPTLAIRTQLTWVHRDANNMADISSVSWFSLDVTLKRRPGGIVLKCIQPYRLAASPET